jgi:hypothetical protein
LLYVFAPENELLRASALRELLTAEGLAVDVRERATGFRLAVGELVWEVRRVRASDLTRELGPRLRDAPAPVVTALRQVEVGFAIPPEPHGARVTIAVARLTGGWVHARGVWSRLSEAGLERVE